MSEYDSRDKYYFVRKQGLRGIECQISNESLLPKDYIMKVEISPNDLRTLDELDLAYPLTE